MAVGRRLARATTRASRNAAQEAGKLKRDDLEAQENQAAQLEAAWTQPVRSENTAHCPLFRDVSTVVLVSLSPRLTLLLFPVAARALFLSPAALRRMCCVSAVS
jgi:hypothetical protein